MVLRKLSRDSSSVIAKGLLENEKFSPNKNGSVKHQILQKYVTEKKKSKNDSGGQTSLWQFLLELLSNPEFHTIIQWKGEDGTFQLNRPNEVANMWGERKNKPGMTYEKLSRSLRYYYDKQIMTKVNGKRFSYKFNLDGLNRAYHPTGVSDSCFIQAQDLNCTSRNFPLAASLQIDFTGDEKKLQFQEIQFI